MAPASSTFVFTFGLDALEGGVSPETAPRVIVAPVAGGRPWEFPIKTVQGSDGGRRVQCRQSRTSTLFSPFHLRSAEAERALRSFGGLGVSSVPWVRSPARRGVVLPSVCEAGQHKNLQVYSISGETSDGTADQRLFSTGEFTNVQGRVSFPGPRKASQIGRRLLRSGFCGGGEQRGDMNRFCFCPSGTSFVHENHRSGMASRYSRRNSFQSKSSSRRTIAKGQRHTLSKRSAACRRIHLGRVAVCYGQGKESG